MRVNRRTFLTGGTAITLRTAVTWPQKPREDTMYGLIGRLTAVSGQRDALVAILLEGISGMPGCLSYVVATDPKDAHAIWITEVWENEASHKASLALPAVRQAITRGKPLIASFDHSAVTTPVGGHGLPQTSSR